MLLSDFQYHRVHDLQEAREVLSLDRGCAKILAGGTDLLLQMKQGNVWGQACPRRLVSLKAVKGLDVLGPENGVFRIGANVTHRRAELSPVVQKELAALHDAVRDLASVQIRNVATIAGNICNAAPCADTAAPLLALGAQVKTLGPRGERRIDLADFWEGPGRIVLEPDEILTEIRIPETTGVVTSAYMAIAKRKAMDITTVGVAVCISYDADEARILQARIALNTVAPTPIRAYEAEAFLEHAPLGEAVFQEAADVAAKHCSPRTSFRSTAVYRREMVRVMLKRALAKAAERINPIPG
jgi:CO/xanthine dehydrogenase FAD-binding subunit